MKPAALLCALALAVGCGGETVDFASGDDPAEPTDVTLATERPPATPQPEPEPIDIAWQPCPLHSGGSGLAAECAEVSVPADWGATDGVTITLFVKRVGHANATRSLWMLNGGPGASGAGFESYAELFTDEDPQLRVYLPDHRGVGRSSRLGCAEQEADESDEGLTITDAEWPACIDAVVAQWGPALSLFNTTQAAHDIGQLVTHTRGPDEQVVIWGGSYGTYWLQRYLQLYPAQVTAVSMLGIASPLPEGSFANYDATYNQVGLQYLTKCAGDAFCAGKLGDDPAGKAAAVLASLDMGHCPQAVASGLDREALRSLFAYFMMWSWNKRAIVPALIYRLERCNAGDQEVFAYLGAALAAPTEPDIYDRLHGTVLARNISISEMFVDPPPLAELEAVVEEAAFSLAVGPKLRRLYEQWPRYPIDSHVHQLADSDLPMLNIQGELDPATPLSRARTVGEHFNGSDQHFIEVANAPHSFRSPMANGYDCQLLLFFSYVMEPSAPLVDCLDSVLPLDFEGDATTAWTYFNQPHLWLGLGEAAASGEDATKGGPSVNPEAALAELRRGYHAARRGQLPHAR